MYNDKKVQKVLTPLFLISAFITSAFAIWAIISPNQLTLSLSVIQQFFVINYGWFLMLLPVLFAIICLFFGFSKKYGHIRLGGTDSRPKFSTFSWLAMLFTAGIGIGIVYFGINQPLYAYYLSPMGISNTSVSQMEAARHAMGMGVYLWGIGAWVIFSIAGLVVGYFVYTHGGKYLPGEAITMGFGSKKWAKPVSQTMNILSVVCAALTIATTIGLGVIQMSGGIKKLFLIPDNISSILPFIILAILFVLFTSAAVTPLQKGMKIIGNINMYMAIGIMVFVMVFGPTRFIFEQIVTTFGTFIDTLIVQNFEMYIFSEQQSFVYDWAATGWLWWISWTPFMGVFVASISYGRTLKEYAIATMTAPVAFMILWICTFGGTAMLNVIQGDGSLSQIAMSTPDMTFFALLDTLPFSQLTTIFTLVLILFFLATTCTGCSVSLSTMTDLEGKTNSATRAGVWSVLMSIIAIAAIVATFRGGNDAFNGIKALATTMTIPYLVFFIISISAFIKQIVVDNKEMSKEVI
jgi:choline-glycine betaine transporter